MDRYPTITAAKDPKKKFGSVSVVLGSDKNLWNPLIPAPIISGTEIRKENLAADCRSRSLSIAPVMVTPEREIPGKSAKIWNIPIQNASFQFIFSKVRFLSPIFSAIASSTAVPIKKIAVIFGLSKNPSKNLFKVKPAMPAGIVARIRYKLILIAGALRFFPLIAVRLPNASTLKSSIKYERTAIIVAAWRRTSYANA